MLNTIVKNIYGRVCQHRDRLDFLVVILPMVLVTVYYIFIATTLFASESKVIVKHTTDSASELVGLSLPFLGGTGGASDEDALHLKEFLQSADILERLDKRLGLRKEYSLKKLDIINMLSPWATKEEFLRLYRKRVDIGFDDKTGVLTIRTLGSTAEFAQKLNQTILQEAEKFINELSHKIAREQVDFASQELRRARKGLDEAKENLLGYQNKNEILDPAISAEVANRVIADLQAQLVSKEIELNTLGSMLQSNAAQVVTLRKSIVDIRRQIEIEKQKLVSPDVLALNRVAASYLDYKAMVDFQTDIYKVSLAAFEKMRLDAIRKVKSLAIISNPQLAEESENLKHVYMLAAWLFGLSLLFGLTKLTIEIIEDHRD